MSDIRDLLIQNEEEAQKAYFQETGIKPDHNKIAIFRALRKDGDLYRYVMGRKSAIQTEARNEFYHSHGFQTAEDILKANSKNLHLDQYTSEESLHKGDLVNSYEICAMSDNFNAQIGMHSCKDKNGRLFAVIKSDIGGHYKDRWLLDKISFQYYVQEEDPVNLLKPSFRFAGNILIFSDFLSGQSAQRLPIFLFVRDLGKGELFYTYEGIYNVNSMLDGNKAFELVTFENEEESIFAHKRTVSIDDFLKKSTDEIIKGRILHRALSISKPKIVIPQPSFVEKPFVERGKNGPDYIKQASIEKKVGDIGESFAQDYEKRRVASFANPKQVLLAEDECGFDMRSFEKTSTGIREVHIEIKTTGSNDPYSGFFMSKNEYLTMTHTTHPYWIYRVYNVFADNPDLLPLQDPASGRLKADPSNYFCRIIK